MLDFDKISKITNRLVDKVLNGDKVDREDLNSEQLSAEDKDYIIDALQDANAVNQRNNAIEDFNQSKTKDWKKIEAIIAPSKQKLYPLKRILKVAAVLFIGIFIGYLTLGDMFFGGSNTVAAVNSDSVLLEFNHGMVKELSTTGITELSLPDGKMIGTRHGDFLQYKKASVTKASDIVYHQINVPNGKTFKIELSDGTVVHMNSGSSLRYPVQFGESSNRLVTLKGEAYFEVSKDANRPFIVQANEINVRVLGTKFVMNSFDDSPVARTVLIEGSVALYKKETKYSANTASLLSPGQMGELDKSNDQITLKEVDTHIYMDWMEGKLIFNHKAFPEILKNLERHFNITIENQNELLGEQVFTAGFEGESIDEILNVFRRSFPFEYTKINNKKIIINP